MSTNNLADDKFHKRYHTLTKSKPKITWSNANLKNAIICQKRFKSNIHKESESTEIGQISNQKGTSDACQATISDMEIINYPKLTEPEHSKLILDPANKVREFKPVQKNFIFSRKELEENFVYYFLPSGYPDSVTRGYSHFIIYTALGGIAITTMNFISMQALFVALGSTTTQASLYSAAYTWVLKDGIGQLGGILFAGKYGKNFDENVKKWRFL